MLLFNIFGSKRFCLLCFASFFFNFASLRNSKETTVYSMYTESVFLWSALNYLIFKLCFSEYCRHIRSCKLRYFPAGRQKSQGIYSAFLRFIHCRQFCNVFLKERNRFVIEEYCIARRKFE